MKKKFEVGHKKWDAMTPEQRDKHYLLFLKMASKEKKSQKLVTSTDGRLTIKDYGYNCHILFFTYHTVKKIIFNFSKTAKKPNQKRGPQAERTKTFRKMKD